MEDYGDDWVLVVELGKLKQAGSLARFLSSRIQRRIRVRGSREEIDASKHKELKLLLHKFLRENRFDDYRVIFQSGILTVLPPRKPRPALKPSRIGGGMIGLSPCSPYRMNPMTTVEFPNYPPILPRKYKSPKTDET